MDGLLRGSLRGLRKGSVPVWDGSGWKPLPFAGARIYSTASQTSNSNTETTLTFNAKRWDTHNFADLVNLSSRLTIPPGMGGVYQIGAMLVVQASSGTGNLDRIDISMNGRSVYLASTNQNIHSTSTWPAIMCETVYGLTPGNYLEVSWTQLSGTVKTAPYQAERGPEFWLFRVGVRLPSGIAAGAG